MLAILAFVLGYIWFVVACLGLLLLCIPQIAMNIYGSKKQPIDSFLDFMDEVLKAIRFDKD